MLGLTRALLEEKDFRELLSRIDYGGCPLVYSGLERIHAAHAAAAVRRETGRQGAAINEILQKVMVEGKPISDDELKEVVGHSPFEVAMGAVTGVLVVVLWKLIFG